MWCLAGRIYTRQKKFLSFSRKVLALTSPDCDVNLPSKVCFNPHENANCVKCVLVMFLSSSVNWCMSYRPHNSKIAEQDNYWELVHLFQLSKVSLIIFWAVNISKFSIDLYPMHKTNGRYATMHLQLHYALCLD